MLGGLEDNAIKLLSGMKESTKNKKHGIQRNWKKALSHTWEKCFLKYLEKPRKQNILRQRALADHELGNVKEVLMWTSQSRRASTRKIL